MGHCLDGAAVAPVRVDKTPEFPYDHVVRKYIDKDSPQVMLSMTYC